MAIQAQLFPEKFAFAFSGQDDMMLENANSNNHFVSDNYLLQEHQQMKNQAFFFHAGAFQFQSTFQDGEIDQFMRAQKARLRVLLREERKRQLVALMKKVDAVMRHKEEEILKARNRGMELENLVRRLEIEKQVWQKVAQEKEAMVEEMRDRACLYLNLNNNISVADDAESCCEETGESRGMVEKPMTRTMACRVCKSGNLCLVFLPCRHLCSCKQCETLLDSCPVCGSPKNSTIEVLVF